jgi:hypothetical protein
MTTVGRLPGGSAGGEGVKRGRAEIVFSEETKA